jgi:hypothetical protein
MPIGGRVETEKIEPEEPACAGDRSDAFFRRFAFERGSPTMNRPLLELKGDIHEHRRGHQGGARARRQQCRCCDG